MNRGVARRALFETRADARYFLSRLARAVREGVIEVLAYSLMTNHFHILVRSPRAELHYAIGRVENAYSRWFNRVRRRDGPLFRGRFRSRPVEDADHRYMVVRYIDHNPVEARMCARPDLHPWGSAWHYARERRPPWLARTAIEAMVLRACRTTQYRPEHYARVFAVRPTKEQRNLVELRLDAPTSRPDELPDLLGAAHERARTWIAARARAADGRAVFAPLVTPASLQAVLSCERESDPQWTVATTGRPQPGWALIETGLLRFACASTLRDVAARTGASERTVLRRLDHHRASCADGRAGYVERASAVLRAALERDHRPREQEKD